MKKKIILTLSLLVNVVLLVAIFSLSKDIPKHVLTFPMDLSFDHVQIVEQDTAYVLTYDMSYDHQVPEKILDLYYPEYEVHANIITDKLVSDTIPIAKEIQVPLQETLYSSDLMHSNTIERSIEIPKANLSEEENLFLRNAVMNEEHIANFIQFKVKRTDTNFDFLTISAFKDAKV